MLPADRVGKRGHPGLEIIERLLEPWQEGSRGLGVLAGTSNSVLRRLDIALDQGERRATGGRAVFDQVARTVTLSDNAILRDGPNEITGNKVIVYLDEQRSVVEGGGHRVRAVLHPPDKKPGGDGNGR